MKSDEVREALETHAHQELPNECVGLVLRDRIVRLINQARSPHRFYVNPSQLVDKHEEFTSPVVALYHSHPSRQAEPSGEDERMMRYLADLEDWSHIYHIILSPSGHRAYHVVDDEIEERPLPWDT